MDTDLHPAPPPCQCRRVAPARPDHVGRRPRGDAVERALGPHADAFRNGVEHQGRRARPAARARRVQRSHGDRRGLRAVARRRANHDAGRPRGRPGRPVGQCGDRLAPRRGGHGLDGRALLPRGGRAARCATPAAGAPRAGAAPLLDARRRLPPGRRRQRLVQRLDAARRARCAVDVELRADPLRESAAGPRGGVARGRHPLPGAARPARRRRLLTGRRRSPRALRRLRSRARAAGVRLHRPSDGVDAAASRGRYGPNQPRGGAAARFGRAASGRREQLARPSRAPRARPPRLPARHSSCRPPRPHRH